MASIESQKPTVQPVETVNGAPNRGGAPSGNRNHFQNGLRGCLTLGGVPKRCSYVRKIAGRFRRELEAAALDSRGALGLYELATCQSATRHELRCLYAMRELREHGDTLPLPDRLKLWDVIGNATDARDRALQRLGLDAKPANVWDSLDQRYGLTPAAGPEAATSPPSAPAATPGADNGEDGE